MKEAESRVLAEKILAAEWAPVRISRIDLRLQDDHLGEEAFYFNVELAANALPLPVGKLIAGQRELRDALLEAGEKRFPYVRAVNPSGDEGETALRGPAVSR